MSNATHDGIKIFDALASQCLQINPFYIQIAGSITGGYLLTQLVYLFRDVYNYQEFYKKDSYFKEKLSLSEWELRSQKNELVKRGLINIRLGKNKVSHYTINIQKIIDLAVDNSVDKPVDNTLITCESQKSYPRNPRFRIRGILGYVYKEHNTKQRSLNKTNIIDKQPPPQHTNPKTNPLAKDELETIQELMHFGVKRKIAYDWIVKFGIETVRNKANLLKETISYGGVIERKGGWLKRALEQNWG